jgi:DNA-binding CsgD family transcriptional regulator
MAKRGRPRYPDILTPRESEVLTLLREGLTNEQIAQRLGVSRDGVKYHVSEILSKLGVTTREEAAAWRPEEARPWWVVSLALLVRPLKYVPLLGAKAVGGVLVGAALAGVGFLIWGIAATGGLGESEPSTPAPQPSPFTLPSPTVVAGITLYPPDAWFPQGRSLCASLAIEAPYLAPEVFSIRQEELPNLSLPGQEQGTARACKDDITAILYSSTKGPVILANGPHEWPLYSPTDEVSAGEVDGRPAVFVAFQQPFMFTNMIVIAEKYGISAVAVAGTLEEAKQIAAAIDPEKITIPEGKDSFKGALNGIRFYNDLRGEDNRKEGCLWGSYGLEDPEADGVKIPPGTPLDIIPSYLPEGYSLYEKYGTTCGGPIDLVEAQYTAPTPGVVGFGILRLSGEPAWYSQYSEDWLTPETVDGHPAVFITPPAWVPAASAVRDYPVELVIKEDFGLTIVAGRISLEEAKRVAAGLNR